jgi:hypothetical protein
MPPALENARTLAQTVFSKDSCAVDLTGKFYAPHLSFAGLQVLGLHRSLVISVFVIYHITSILDIPRFQ